MKKMPRYLFLLLILLCTPLHAAASQCAETDSFSVYRVADMKIVRLVDADAALPAELFLGNPDAIRWLFPNGKTPTAQIVSYLFDTGAEVVMIDTGLGDLDSGKMLASLKKAGYSPDDVDKVILTHLHGDHVGGTVKNGRAAFPNADIFVSATELAFWSDKAKNASKAPAMLDYTFDLVASFQQVYAERIHTFQDGEAVVDWLRPIAVPGHTDGHTMFELTYKGERRFIWGDIMHAMRAQTFNPEIGVAFDTDPELAVRTRKHVLEMVSDTGIPVFGGHFPAPGVVTFKKIGENAYTYTLVFPE